MESNAENLSLIAHLRKFCGDQSSHKNFSLRNHFLVYRLAYATLDAPGSAFGGAEMCTSALISSRGQRGRWNGREKAVQE